MVFSVGVSLCSFFLHLLSCALVAVEYSHPICSFAKMKLKKNKMAKPNNNTQHINARRVFLQIIIFLFLRGPKQERKKEGRTAVNNIEGEKTKRRRKSKGVAVEETIFLKQKYIYYAYIFRAKKNCQLNSFFFLSYFLFRYFFFQPLPSFLVSQKIFF